VRVQALPGGWGWACSGGHAELARGEVIGEAVWSRDYPDAWSVAQALGIRHAALYHADAARLGLDLDLELRDAEPGPGGPLLPPDPEAVHHLEVCS
jgi:hypothetical protein